MGTKVNRCAHTRPLMKPTHIGYEHESEIIKCSWHQCEFDIKTGQALYDQHPRMKTYLVKVEESNIVIYDS